MTKPTVALIGAGAAGTSLALALSESGYITVDVCSRRIESASAAAKLLNCDKVGIDPISTSKAADIVIIATPDAQIAAVSQTIANAGGNREQQLFLHLSGALTSGELEPNKQQGANVLAFHPIQTMSEPTVGAQLLRESYFSLEGDDIAVSMGRELVHALNGHAIIISRDKKPLYHAALSVCSNYLVALEAIAAELLEAAGVEKNDAINAMLPLIQGSVTNIRDRGLAGSLTGPISRGDSATVKEHLTVIQQAAPAYVEFYQLMGRKTLLLAEEKGTIHPEQSEKINRLLTNA